MGKKPVSLREEIRQTKPFESPTQEAILSVYRKSDVLQRLFVKLVEPHGISLQQYNVLRILRGAGDRLAEPVPEEPPVERQWKVARFTSPT